MNNMKELLVLILLFSPLLYLLYLVIRPIFWSPWTGFKYKYKINRIGKTKIKEKKK